jgi:hypothetical protein
MIADPFDITPLPFDADAYDPKAPEKLRPRTLVAPPFRYDGRGLTLPQFSAFVQVYDFGQVPPSFIVFHHTAVPDASYAPISSNPATKWDRGEQGLDEDAIYHKRQRQLEGLRDFYIKKDWNCGPHLFIDDRYIWLFTPMADVGIHAKWGNSFKAHGKLHYSLGIEIIGYYERVTWPPKVAALVGGVVRALQAKLRTFDLHYMYAAPSSKPGMKIVNGAEVCAHPERLKSGGLSSHRDYNKPACPGAAITEAFYLSVVQLDGAGPPADLFKDWGDVGKPTGEAVNFAIPKAWLVNKKLGRCVVPERTSESKKYAVAEFENGLIIWYAARKTTRVEMFS